MSDSLKILFLEDLLTDLELAVRELQKAGLTFDYICVDTKYSFIESLNEFSPDIIISDYSMPIFNGLEALKCAIEFNKTLPFILLTGSINESVAVECMKAGAWDYVLKDSLLRLPFAVKEALVKKRILIARDEAEKSLTLSHDRLNKAMDVGNLAWWEMTLPSGAVTFSHRKTDMLGYPKENFNHYEDFTKLVHPDDLDLIMKGMMDHLSGEKPSYDVDYRIMRADGEYIWFHDVGAITKRDDDGKPIQITGIVLDINERKIADERQKLFAKVLEILNSDNEWMLLIRDILSEIKKFSAIEAIGVRLKDGDDYPYFLQMGFPEEFIESENLICAKNEDGSCQFNDQGSPINECTCGLILSNKIHSKETYFTNDGSFWTNDSINFLETVTNDNRVNPRNTCMIYKYCSIALIPLMSGDEIIGLLQLNDNKKNRFTIELVQFYEQIGKAIGIALKRMFTEKTILDNEKELLSILENSLDANYKYNYYSDKLEYISPIIEKLTGYSVEEVLAFTFKEYLTLIHPDDRESYSKEFKDSLLSGKINIEYRNRKKNGEYVWVVNSAAIILNENNEPQYRIGNLRDITSRKEAEEALKKSEERFRSYIEDSPIGIFIVDENGKYLDCNSSAQELVGYTRNELLTMRIPDILPTEEIEEALQNFNILLKEGASDLEINLLRKDTSKVPVILNSRRLPNYNLFIAYCTDITERKIAEWELIKAKEKAEEMNRLKSSFLANMSHEIRTPMNGIIGFANILQTEDDIEELHMIGEVILKSGKRLMQTLNSILNLSRIEAGEMKLEFNSVNIIELIVEAISCYKFEAERKSLYINLNIDFETLVIKSEQRILRDIVNNLLDNATKFTNSGGITVSVELAIEDNQQLLIIRVKDTGLGILESDFETIFSEFRQVSEGISRSFEGSGLGLTLCRKYLKTLNGIIGVESKINEGTTFIVKVPVIILNEKLSSYQPENEIHSPNLSISLSGTNEDLPRILYVEDDDVAVMIVKRYLIGLFEITNVNNAKDAVKSASNDAFDIIMMDINLGKGESGVWATKEIRKIENCKDITIIALTAFAMSGDKKEFLDAGCTDYLSKPFEQTELISMLTRYIKQK